MYKYYCYFELLLFVFLFKTYLEVLLGLLFAYNYAIDNISKRLLLLIQFLKVIRY